LPRGVQQTLTTNEMKVLFLKANSKLMLMLAMLLPPNSGILTAQDAAAEPEKERDSIAAQEPALSHKTKRQPQRHRDARREEIVVFGNDVVLQENESARQIVVLAGNARIDGNVDGDVVIVSGSATVGGKIDGQLIVVLGSAKLGPQAEVGGQVVTVGGTLEADPNAQISGDRVTVDFASWLPEFTWLKDWFKQGFLRARPLPPQVAWIWVVAAICLVIYLMLALLFPGSVQASVQALELRPVGSFFVGVLFFLLIGPLVFLLAVSVVGVLIIPFLVCAMIAAFFFGKLVVYRYTGDQSTGNVIKMSTASLAVRKDVCHILLAPASPA
jgi:cytoskeletal protein CcmA (bactofilin family)